MHSIDILFTEEERNRKGDEEPISESKRESKNVCEREGEEQRERGRGGWGVTTSTRGKRNLLLSSCQCFVLLPKHWTKVQPLSHSGTFHAAAV